MLIYDHMTKHHHRHKGNLNKIWLWGLLILAFTMLLSLRSVTLKSFTIESDGRVTKTDFVRTYNGGQLNITANYYHQWYKSTKVILSFNGCLQSLQINSQQLDLNTIPLAQSCGQRKLNIDLAPYVKPGANQFNMGLLNYEGRGSIGMYNDASSDIIYTSLVLLLIVSVCGLGVLVLRKLKLGGVITVIILLGFLIRIFYANYTPYHIRAYDVDGHIDFVEALVRTGTLPKADSCWQCYQPPFYYVIAASTYWAATNLTNFSPINSLQYLSLLISLLFLIVGVLIIKKFIQQEYLVYLAAIVFAFWPGGIINSARVTNDIMLYFLMTVSIYFAVSWWQSKHSNRYLWWSVLFAVLSLWTKNTGLVCAVIISLLLFLKVIKYRNWKWFKSGIFVALVLLTGWATAYIGRIINPPTSKMDLLIGNIAGNDSTIDVNNNLGNFLQFNPTIYFEHPFTSPREDRLGRQYVSNYIIKTSLFGEFEYEGEMVAVLGKLISFVALAIIICAVFQSLVVLFKKNKHLLVNFMVAFVILGSLIAVRVRYPTSATMDFRFIVPFLIPLAISFVSNVTVLKQVKWLVYVEYFLAISLAVFTTLLFLIAIPLKV